MSRATKLLTEIYGLNSAAGRTVKYTYSKPAPPKNRNTYSSTSILTTMSSLSDSVDELDVTLSNFIKSKGSSRVIEKYIEVEDAFLDTQKYINEFESQLYFIRDILNNK